jgi:hypothetical protein
LRKQKRKKQHYFCASKNAENNAIFAQVKMQKTPQFSRQQKCRKHRNFRASENAENNAMREQS